MSFSAVEHKLKTARNIDELNFCLNQILSEKGISMYSFTYYAVHPSSRKKIKYDLASAKFRTWHEYYLDQHYDEIDTTFQSFKETNLPIFWDVREQIKYAKTKKEKQMRQDALKFGAVKGLSIPLFDAYQGHASLTLVQMKAENWLEGKNTELKFYLFVIAHCYFSFLQKHLLSLHHSEKNLLTH